MRTHELHNDEREIQDEIGNEEQQTIWNIDVDGYPRTGWHSLP